MYGSGQSSDPAHMNTGSQPASSHHANDATLTSSGPAGNMARDPVGQGGIGSIQQGSNPLPASHTSGMSGVHAGSVTSIKSGLPGNSQESKITGLPETRDALDTNKPLPHEPTTGGLGSSATVSGAHPSGSGDKADPRLDSERGFGSRGAATSTGGLVGSSLPDRTAET